MMCVSENQSHSLLLSNFISRQNYFTIQLLQIVDNISTRLNHEVTNQHQSYAYARMDLMPLVEFIYYVQLGSGPSA